ncbi:MAG: TIGR03435 family protein [Acidobacteriia bacterium]|nr:TIGR03435 family protein [Terriglobia bacterium]
MQSARPPALPLFLLFLTSAGLAQAPASSPPAGPTFDVVSIERNTDQPRVSGVTDRPDGGIRATNVRAGQLIARAYPPAIPADIAGLPDWATTERYDVIATSTLTRATPEDRAAMMRAMLAERFNLIAHVEHPELPVYDLVLARSDGKLGRGLTPTEVDCEAQLAAERVVDDLMEGDTTLANLAGALRTYTGRSVVDKTGLTGFYRVKMTVDLMASRRPEAAALRPDAPSVFTAVQDDLGLKLQSSRATGLRLVVDRIERPTPN